MPVLRTLSLALRQRTLQKLFANKPSTVCGTLFAATLLLATSAWGQGKVLYSFNQSPDGNYPTAGLVRDAAGNFYGATPGGGDLGPQQCQAQPTGCGVVYELTNSGGTWTQSIIHTFVPGTDGINPFGNLIFDSAGNLYGTTQYGGTGCGGFYGCGTVYELSPASGGAWTETVIYNFTGGSDGVYPEAGLIMDSAGNLYGTTGFGANSACNTLGCGTVFKLTRGTGGTWTESLLYVFQGGADGGEPRSEVVFDAAGNLYGNTAIGGDLTCNPPYGCGTVYKLSPASGGWTETALHTFEGGISGFFPNSGLTIDKLGNLYGNMSSGGASGYGYVYRLIPRAGGIFAFNSVYSFDLTHGGRPENTPLVSGGIVYGTASAGGGNNKLCPSGCGGVFKLLPTGSGIHYAFLGFGISSNGAAPMGNLIKDPVGNLYGTASAGGAHGYGTVFEILQ
jgi:uncharacterized repeat protein (TIGR03803 family)